MSFELRADESPVAGLKRITREQLDSGLERMQSVEQREGDAGEHVHETRKSLKKSRAVIRLLRDEVGKGFYRTENERMRDAGRMVSSARDADAMLETLGRLGGEAPARLRETLEKEREEQRARLASDADTLSRFRSSLEETRARVDAWPLDRVDAGLFAPSLKRTYKRGRKAFGAAYKKPGPERFHELRKQVKYLWYDARILRPCAADLDTFTAWADDAGDRLGLDHDLALLAGRVESLGSRAGTKAEREQLLEAIEQQRLNHERWALPLLRRLYAESPKGFTSRIAERFEDWRRDQAPLPVVWLTPGTARSARAALRRKGRAKPAEQRRIRERLRAWGLEAGELGGMTASGRGLGVSDLDELTARGVIGVGSARELSGSSGVDVLRTIDLDASTPEASGICPIESEATLRRCGWDLGFWLILDDVPASEGTLAIGRARRDGETTWEALSLEVAGASDGAETDDGEDCVRIGEWIYVFGSHHGSRRGPAEAERQFVARFREAEALGAEPVELQVAHTGFGPHRLINDALADRGVEVWDLSEEARATLIDGDEEQVEPGDHPINLEGVVQRRGGGVLLGLRYPVSADGHPLLVEVEAVESLFSGGLPKVGAVYVLDGVGNRHAPAGIRALGIGPGGDVEAVTGNLDPTGGGSALLEAHPEGALARSVHFRLSFKGGKRSPRVEAELVRELPGFTRVRGVAADRLGRTFYAIDEDERVRIRYAETLETA